MSFFSKNTGWITFLITEITIHRNYILTIYIYTIKLRNIPILAKEA